MATKGKKNKKSTKRGNPPTMSFGGAKPRFQPASVRWMNPIVPDRVLTRLRACTAIQTSDSVISDDFVLFANSAWDPFGVETSLQPKGYDIFALLYQKYKVWNCKVAVTTLPTTSTTSEGPEIVAVFPSDDSTAVTNFAQASSHEYGKWRVIGAYKSSASGFAANAVSLLDKKLTITHSTQKMLGISEVGYESEAIGASVGSDPGLAWYYHVYLGNLAGTNVRAYHMIELTMDVEFYDREEHKDSENRGQKLRKAFEERKIRSPHRRCLIGSQKLAAEAKWGKPEKKEKRAPQVRDVERASQARDVEKASWADAIEDEESMYSDFLNWKSKTAKMPPFKES